MHLVIQLRLCRNQFRFTRNRQLSVAIVTKLTDFHNTGKQVCDILSCKVILLLYDRKRCDGKTISNQKLFFCNPVLCDRNTVCIGTDDTGFSQLA